MSHRQQICSVSLSFPVSPTSCLAKDTGTMHRNRSNSVKKREDVYVQTKGFFSWSQKEKRWCMLIGNNMLLTRGEDDEHPVTIDVRTDFVDLKLSKEFVSFSAKKNRYRMWPVSGDARSWHRAMTRIGRKSSGLDRSNRVIVPLKYVTQSSFRYRTFSRCTIMLTRIFF